MAVGHRAAAGGVGADVVAFDLVGAGAAARDDDAVTAVAGDQVARPGGGAADRVVGRAVQDHDAAVVCRAVAQRAGGVGADVVALDLVGAGAAVADFDALLVVAGDQVARAGGGAADRVVGGAVQDPDTVAIVAKPEAPPALRCRCSCPRPGWRWYRCPRYRRRRCCCPRSRCARRRRCRRPCCWWRRSRSATPYAVGERVAAGGVGADVVALDLVGAGAAARDIDAVVVAGDQVARAGGGAADRVVCRDRSRSRHRWRWPAAPLPAALVPM